MKIAVIADDLTGALDSAVAFAVRGLRTVCACTVNDLEAALKLEASVIAVSTSSREIREPEAVARVSYVQQILQQDFLHSNGIVFKKIDSRLKGHVAAETKALHRHGQKRIVCPAIPRLGRFVVNGALTGSGVACPIPVAPLVGADPGEVLEAASDQQIDKGIAPAPTDALFVGAAGLAEALARTLVPTPQSRPEPMPSAPALIAIGSRDPVTLAQLQNLETIPAPNGEVPDPSPQAGSYQLLQLTAGAHPLPADMVEQTFTRGVAQWVEMTNPATLVLSGGETASAALACLGIRVLEIQGEVLSGLPFCRALDGRPSLGIVTKSGGFGTPQTLMDLIRYLAEPAPRILTAEN